MGPAFIFARGGSDSYRVAGGEVAYLRAHPRLQPLEAAEAGAVAGVEARGQRGEAFGDGVRQRRVRLPRGGDHQVEAADGGVGRLRAELGAAREDVDDAVVRAAGDQAAASVFLDEQVLLVREVVGRDVVGPEEHSVGAGEELAPAHAGKEREPRADLVFLARVDDARILRQRGVEADGLALAGAGCDQCGSKPPSRT